MTPKEGPARKVYPEEGDEDKERKKEHAEVEEEMVSFPFLLRPSGSCFKAERPSDASLDG